MVMISVLVLLGLGLVTATVLAVASRVFHVEEDPRVQAVLEALPGYARTSHPRLPSRLQRGIHSTSCLVRILQSCLFLPPQLRRRLLAFPLALITALTVLFLPEEQLVHHASGPCPHAVPRPTVTARGQGFVGPAPEKRIDELVNGDQRSLAVGHASPPPGMEMLTVIPCTSSSVVQASSRSSSA